MFIYELQKKSFGNIKKFFERYTVILSEQSINFINLCS